MPFPNKGVSLLLQRPEVTRKERFALLEARRELVKPHLHQFKLPTLSDVKCLKQEHHAHELGLDRFSLESNIAVGPEFRGMFGYGVRKIEPGGRRYPNGTRYLWGLMREGDWVLITVEFKGERGYKDRGYERAETVRVESSNPQQICEVCEIEPEQIAKVIWDYVEHWRMKRETALRHADEVLRAFHLENTVIELIRQNNLPDGDEEDEDD